MSGRVKGGQPCEIPVKKVLGNVGAIEFLPVLASISAIAGFYLDHCDRYAEMPHRGMNGHFLNG